MNCCFWLVLEPMRDQDKAISGSPSPCPPHSPPNRDWNQQLLSGSSQNSKSPGKRKTLFPNPSFQLLPNPPYRQNQQEASKEEIGSPNPSVSKPDTEVRPNSFKTNPVLPLGCSASMHTLLHIFNHHIITETQHAFV